MKRTAKLGVVTLNADAERTPEGVWIRVGGERLFLDFATFPWFSQATIDQISEVTLWHSEHLYWPKLDVDLDFHRIRHPEKYPLAAKTSSDGIKKPVP